MEFLTSVIALKSQANTHLHTDQKIGEITLKTLKRSLSIIKSWLCDPEKQNLLSEKMLNHCVWVILSVLDSDLSASRQEVTEHVCGMVESLLVEMVQCTTLNNVSRHGFMMIYLFTWGFYAAFNTVQVISRRVVGRAEETST